MEDTVLREVPLSTKSSLRVTLTSSGQPVSGVMGHDIVLLLSRRRCSAHDQTGATDQILRIFSPMSTCLLLLCHGYLFLSLIW